MFLRRPYTTVCIIRLLVRVTALYFLACNVVIVSFVNIFTRNILKDLSLVFSSFC